MDSLSLRPPKFNFSKKVSNKDSYLEIKNKIIKQIDTSFSLKPIEHLKILKDIIHSFNNKNIYTKIENKIENKKEFEELINYINTTFKYYLKDELKMTLETYYKNESDESEIEDNYFSDDSKYDENMGKIIENIDYKILGTMDEFEKLDIINENKEEFVSDDENS